MKRLVLLLALSCADAPAEPEPVEPPMVCRFSAPIKHVSCFQSQSMKADGKCLVCTDTDCQVVSVWAKDCER